MMKPRGLTFVIGLIATLLGGTAVAQCSLDECATPCQGGCGVSFPIQHSRVGYGPERGAFWLEGSSFASTCRGTSPGCTVAVPPVRFWSYDSYAVANSGCASPRDLWWIANGQLDLGLMSPPGAWYLYSANWAHAPSPGPDRVDGCIAHPAAQKTTVVEMNWADAESGEGTVEHDAWYLVTAVDLQAGLFEFDRIVGGDTSTPPGDGPAAIRLASVPDVAIGTATCPDNGTGVTATVNPVDPGFLDVAVDLSTVAPDWFTHNGRNAAPQLIAGMQIVYTDSPTAPTSSESALAGWRPALDPADPVNRVAAVWLWGSSGPMTVSVPDGGDPTWLAARLVYLDGTVNADLGPVPATSSPRLVSLPGGSCGPVDGPNIGCAGAESIGNSLHLVRQEGDIAFRWSANRSASYNLRRSPQRWLDRVSAELVENLLGSTHLLRDEVGAPPAARSYQVLGVDCLGNEEPF